MPGLELCSPSNINSLSQFSETLSLIRQYTYTYMHTGLYEAIAVIVYSNTITYMYMQLYTISIGIYI